MTKFEASSAYKAGAYKKSVYPCCATPEIVSKYPGFKSSYHLFHRNSVTGVQQLMVEHRFRGFLGVSGNLGI